MGNASSPSDPNALYRTLDSIRFGPHGPTRPLPDPILFTYPISIHGRRISSYLTLRQLPHQTCTVQNRMPRPELSALNIAYRRIPILAIGRDLYCDTRLILPKLSHFYLPHQLYSAGPAGAALSALLESWTQDGGLFWAAASLAPARFIAPLGPEWAADRQELTGRKWEPETLALGRREGLVRMRAAFEMVETCLLGDGRAWVLGEMGPSVADLQAVWPFDWLLHEDFRGALEEGGCISEGSYPRVFAWLRRYQEALSAARETAPQPKEISGGEILAGLKTAGWAEPEMGVDEMDPLGLRKGMEVEVWPTDTGSNHRDRGVLVGLGVGEVVIRKRTRERGEEIRVHFPRSGFRVVPV